MNFKNVTLKRATFVKLRPQSKDFLDISNHRAVLEKTLRSYTCLTVGDSIVINYNDKKYFIDILETKPNDAVSIVEVRSQHLPPAELTPPSSRPRGPGPRTLTRQIASVRRRTARWTSPLRSTGWSPFGRRRPPPCRRSRRVRGPARASPPRSSVPAQRTPRVPPPCRAASERDCARPPPLIAAAAAPPPPPEEPKFQAFQGGARRLVRRPTRSLLLSRLWTHKRRPAVAAGLSDPDLTPALRFLNAALERTGSRRRAASGASRPPRRRSRSRRPPRTGRSRRPAGRRRPGTRGRRRWQGRSSSGGRARPQGRGRGLRGPLRAQRFGPKMRGAGCLKRSPVRERRCCEAEAMRSVCASPRSLERRALRSRPSRPPRRSRRSSLRSRGRRTSLVRAEYER